MKSEQFSTDVEGTKTLTNVRIYECTKFRSVTFRSEAFRFR